MASTVSNYSLFKVKDWDLYEERIEWLVEQKMGRCAKDTSLVLLEPPIHNREWRLKAVEMFFEKFGGDSISFLKSSLMASYANSLPNSLIVDIGASSVYVAPIYEGVIMKESLLKGDFGSASLNPLLRTEITNRRADYLNISSIKTSMASKFPVLADRIKDDLIEQIKREKFKVTDTSSFRMVYNENIDNSVFELPDNKNIIIGKEAHDVPEQFFYHEKDGRPAQNPTSLQNLIYQCLENVKNYKRKDMLENIILTGGGSCIFNLSERLERELKVLLKDLSYVSKISSAHNLVERECTGWMGASVVASMSTFGEYLMDKSEYGDHGSLLIERKCLC